MTGLAKVGDRIEHGQPIPGNVVCLRDASGARWSHRLPDYRMARLKDSDTLPVWFPMTVVEVDPEPQPAEPGMVADGCSWCQGHGYTPGQQLTHEGVPVESPSQPVVLRLPEVPEGTVALIDREQRRWTPARIGAQWELLSPDGDELLNWRTLGNLLGDFGPLTIEFAPPREPRTWPKLEDEPADEAPRLLDVSSEPGGSYPVRWTQHDCIAGHAMYTGPLGGSKTLAELRTAGWVREVLS